MSTFSQMLDIDYRLRDVMGCEEYTIHIEDENEVSMTYKYREHNIRITIQEDEGNMTHGWVEFEANGNSSPDSQEFSLRNTDKNVADKVLLALVMLMLDNHKIS